MAWFKKKQSPPVSPVRSVRIPRELQHPGDWIVVPFRFAEAARVSIHTIACQEEIPEVTRYWITRWLAEYNYHLVEYMKEYYGPGILPVLDRITHEVSPGADQSSPEATSAPWDRWESQFKEEDYG